MKRQQSEVSQPQGKHGPTRLALMLLAPLCVLSFALASCSHKGTYTGIQTSNRNQCPLLPPSQYDECMERAAVSWEEYERERKLATEP